MKLTTAGTGARIGRRQAQTAEGRSKPGAPCLPPVPAVCRLATSSRSGFCLVVFEREAEEVLEEEATVARLVGVRPARAVAGLFAQEAVALFGREVGVDAREVARQVLKGLLQVELDGVDELAVGALDHHLVAAAVGVGEQPEAFGHAVELEAVVLPDAQRVGRGRAVLPDAGASLADALEDGVVGREHADVVILVLELPALAPLGGFEVV